MFKKFVFLLALFCNVAFALSETYKVNVAPVEHGRVELAGIFASGGESTYIGNVITVALKPDSGYVVDALSIVGANEAEVSYSEKANNQFEFTMPASAVTVKASFKIGTYKLSISGCEHVTCELPSSAQFGEEVSLKIIKTDYELMFGVQYTRFSEGDIERVSFGDTTTYKFTMPGFDVDFTMMEAHIVPRQTEYNVKMTGCEVIKCTAPEKAKVGETVTVKSELVDGIVGINFEVKGLGTVNSKPLDSGKGWEYEFTMPKNDVEFIFTTVAASSSSEASVVPSETASSSSVSSSGASSDSEKVEPASAASSASKPASSSSSNKSTKSSDSKGDASEKSSASSSASKSDKYKLTVDGCGGLKCTAPDSAKVGESVEVKIVITDGYSGFDIGVKGVGAVDQENEDKVTYLRFKMPANDVVFSVTPNEKESAKSSSSKASSGSSSSKLKDGEYAVSVEGCGKLKCKAPESAKKGDSVEVTISLVSGYNGFDLAATGIGEMEREKSGNDYFIRFKMPENDVVLTVTPKASKTDKENQGDAIATVHQVPVFKVTSVAREIRVSGAAVGAKVQVFDMQGVLVSAGRVDAANFNVVMPRSGTYMVRVADQVQKVVVK